MATIWDSLPRKEAVPSQEIEAFVRRAEAQYRGDFQ